MDSGKSKAEYFRGKDWTVSRTLKALGKFVAWRTGWNAISAAGRIQHPAGHKPREG